MDEPQATITTAVDLDAPAAGALMESMWKLHGEETNLVDVTKILNVHGADYIKDVLKSENATIFVARAGKEVVGVASCFIRPLPS
jgi:hypothetical protein